MSTKGHEKHERGTKLGAAKYAEHAKIRSTEGMEEHGRGWSTTNMRRGFLKGSGYLTPGLAKTGIRQLMHGKRGWRATGLGVPET